MRIVTIDGDHVASGTDTFAVNPFSSSIENLAVADNLAAGLYAIAVSGSGNRSFQPDRQPAFDIGDFATRIQVLHPTLVPEVPEPDTYALMLAGLGLVGFAARRRKTA
ncbi:MAG: FxDxF family PEP-CTERM protein [Burkholderiaceae bacterium]|nr:FxDxF family PEP-CTERM protein [Burkholderiaceae bacterium]